MSKNKKEEKAAVFSLPGRDDGVQPQTKAFSIAKVPGGWSFVELTFDRGVLTDVTSTEPNLKAFAINDFKKAAFHYWSTLG